MYGEDAVNNLLKWMGFSPTDTAVGAAFKLSPDAAFIFSTVTGAAYLDSDTWPFSPRGLTKIFNKALGKDVVWGLFEDGEVANGPWELEINRPFLFSSEKFVLVKSFQSESDYAGYCRKVRKILKNPEDYLLLRLESWKKGSGLEPILEYFGAVVLAASGYFVESQIPLSPKHGSPDLAAFHLGNLKAKVGHCGADLPLRGHILKFLLFDRFRIQDQSSDYRTSSQNGFPNIPVPTSRLVVCEAKTGREDYSRRLFKYLQSGFFDEGLALIDNRVNIRDPLVWKLGFDETGTGFGFRPTSRLTTVGTADLMNQYEEWLEALCVCYFLSGLHPSRRLKVVEMLKSEINPSKQSSSFESLYQLATTLGINELTALAFD